MAATAAERVATLASHLSARPTSGENRSAETAYDPFRMPIVVGVARLTKPPHQGHRGTFLPSELAAEALTAAIADTGAPDLAKVRAKIDTMGMPFHRAEPTDNTTRKA